MIAYCLRNEFKQNPEQLHRSPKKIQPPNELALGHASISIAFERLNDDDGVVSVISYLFMSQI